MAADMGPAATLPLPYVVTRRRRELRGTYTLELEPASGEGGVSPAPGQFNMLYAFGSGEVPISVSGLASDGTALVHTIRDVGPVTKALCGLKVGETVGLRGPFGTSWPVDSIEGNDVVIVAGGLGLAPLRPAIRQVLEHRQNFGRVVLLYGTRTPEDILFRAELQRWRGRFDLDVEVTVDSADSSWSGDVGVVTRLISREQFDPLNTVALVCGPEIMIRFAAQELENKGVATEDIYVSLERNMKCAVGFCGHCQFGSFFVCKDGPVFSYDRIKRLAGISEV
jgi:NAD(P)H-flavin reductase